MEQSAQLVDKAVSTEDLSFETRDVNLDVARIEAVLTTLVENKVEAMKNDKTKSSSSHSTPMTWDKRLQRITSTSTQSSHKENNHHKLHHYHKKRIKHNHHDRDKDRKHHRTNGRGHRVSSNSPESPRYRMHSPQGRVCCEHGISDDELPYDFMQYPELAERAYLDACETNTTHCSCPDNHNGQIKMHYDDDYVSINMEDFENIEEDAIITHDALRRARRKRRRRRRKKRKRHHQAIVIPTVEKVKIVDPDDLPQRARWTIVATACLLLLMCLLLVGVTLRMAPIIDDMVRKENEELLNSLHREPSYNSTSVIASPP